MTILASTADHLVEVEARVFSIARRTDGNALSCKNKSENNGVVLSIGAWFKISLVDVSAEKLIATYIRMLEGRGIKWEPLYNPAEMPI